MSECSTFSSLLVTLQFLKGNICEVYVIHRVPDRIPEIHNAAMWIYVYSTQCSEQRENIYSRLVNLNIKAYILVILTVTTEK